MSQDSINLPSPEAMIRDGLTQICRLRKRLSRLGQAHVFGGLGLTVALIIVSASRDVPDMLAHVAISLGVGGAAAGAALWASSLLLRSQRAYYHASKFDFEQLRKLLNAAVAQILQRLASLETAREADRKAFIEKLVAMEARREADMDAAREAARKRFEELHQQIDDAWKASKELGRSNHKALYDGMYLLSENQESIYKLLSSVHERLAEQRGEPVDPKYLLDMSDAIEIGREIERRKPRPPDEPDPD